jgi:hypothetical protein
MRAERYRSTHEADRLEVCDGSVAIRFGTVRQARAIAAQYFVATRPNSPLVHAHPRNQITSNKP